MSRPWTLEGLTAVRVLAATNADQAAIAEAVGRFKAEIDLALWALVGRSPQQAVARLNGGATNASAVPVPPARGPGLGAFLGEMGW